MNVKKQQMHLQLKPQQQPPPPQRRHNRTGFETLLDQAQATDDSPSSPGAYRNGTVGGGAPQQPQQQQWSTLEDQRPRHAVNCRYDSLQRVVTPVNGATADSANSAPPSPLSPSAGAVAAAVNAGPGRWPVNGTAGSPGGWPAEELTTPTSPSQLSLPSPYYDRNPVVGFPLHHQLRHYGQHGAKSPVPVAPATVPLANVQNVVYPGDQDHNDHHLANNTKVSAHCSAIRPYESRGFFKCFFLCNRVSRSFGRESSCIDFQYESVYTRIGIYGKPGSLNYIPKWCFKNILVLSGPKIKSRRFCSDKVIHIF